MASIISQPWGKLQRDEDAAGEVIAWLALVDHCIDVGMVFRELCDLPGIRRALEHAAGTALCAGQCDRLAVFALLHDIGKANLGFQRKADPEARQTVGHVREVGVLFCVSKLQTLLSNALDVDLLATWFMDAHSDVVKFLIAAISHHGRPAFDGHICGESRIHADQLLWQKQGSDDPFETVQSLIKAAQGAFPHAFSDGIEALPAPPALQHLFAGLVMLADWLGSHREAFFPYEHSGERAQWARQQARLAFRETGLDVSMARQALAPALPTFADMFGFEPRPLQQTLNGTFDAPLLIAESDTGSGKTEAALAHFVALFAAGQVDSLYFALPTRVAAREIYHRVQATMAHLFGEVCPPVLLAVPGYTRIDGEPATILPDSIHLFQDDPHLRKRERAWSAERPKRFLAAPIAVGTIDQALLGILQTPHAHLRAACLGRSLLVVDEVHASDVYMRYLLRHLLDWHLSLGGRALLLSATLGGAARAELLARPDERAAIPSYEDALAAAYPAVSGVGMGLRHLPDTGPGSRVKTVYLEPVPLLDDPECLRPRLRDAMHAGQKVLMIFNTVGRANAMLRSIEDDPELVSALFRFNGVICPHHGRFSRVDREGLDEQVTVQFGKGSRNGPLLLIGTQTLEQSLDIDADWLISDLCPMDVLLQRIGRLHRHDRGVRSRPVCSVLVPDDANLEALIRPNGQVWGAAGMGTVYADLRILQLTRAVIGDGRTIEIPADNRALVEAATHPEKLRSLTGPSWRRHASTVEGAGLAQAMAADLALIKLGDFGEFTFQAMNDQVSTRLGMSDRRLRLAPPLTSPFGCLLEEINIPGWLAGDARLDDFDEPPQQVDEGVRLRYGGRQFVYSRFGLEQYDEPTH